MNMHRLPIELKKIDPRAAAPKYQTAGAAGADFYSFCPDGPITIEPGAVAKIRTGVALFIGSPA